MAGARVRRRACGVLLATCLLWLPVASPGQQTRGDAASPGVLAHCRGTCHAPSPEGIGSRGYQDLVRPRHPLRLSSREWGASASGAGAECCGALDTSGAVLDHGVSRRLRAGMGERQEGAMRLRGGRGPGSGERDFVGDGGKSIRVNAHGEVVSSDVKAVKTVADARKMDKAQDVRRSEKRRQGELRRETKRATLQKMTDDAIGSMPSKDRIVHQDPAYRPNFLLSLEATEREPMQAKIARQMRMRKTSERRTTQVARQMRLVSRRKGKRTKKHVPLKQLATEAARKEAVAQRGARKETKDEDKRHIHTAIQHLTEEIAETPEEEKKMVREQRMRGVKKVSSFSPGRKDMLDDGTGNIELEFEAIIKMGDEIHKIWAEKQTKMGKTDSEKWAYMTSKDYLKKKKQEEAKSKRIAAARKRLADAKGSNRKKKQDKRLGFDRTITNMDGAGAGTMDDRDKTKGGKGGKGSAESRSGGKRAKKRFAYK